MQVIPILERPGIQPTSGLLSYAILNLAAQHLRLGHLTEAKQVLVTYAPTIATRASTFLQAVWEAVKVAQDHNDSQCLAQALLWISKLKDLENQNSSHTSASREVAKQLRILGQCSSRARELGKPEISVWILTGELLDMKELNALMELNLAQYHMTHPQRVIQTVKTDQHARRVTKHTNGQCQSPQHLCPRPLFHLKCIAI